MSQHKCSCYYRSGLNCSGDDRPCANCGWNPEVEKARKEKLSPKKETAQIKSEIDINQNAMRTWIVRWV